MKTLKKLLIWIIILIAIIVLISFLLPSKYSVERTVVIKADKEIIFDQICNFKNWDNWTPWGTDMDATAEYEIIGGCEVGAVQRWTGDEIGVGEMTITKMIPYQLLEYHIEFDAGKYSSDGYFKLDPQGNAYLVTWMDEGELGYNPIYRYMGLFMDKFMGPSFETGLENLKKIAEGLPTFPDIEVVMIESTPSISILDSSTMADMGMAMGEMFSELMTFMDANNVNVTGHPYTIYYTWNPDGLSVMEAGIPVDNVRSTRGRIMATESPGGKAVKAIYFGPYEGIGVAHEAIDKYVKLNGLEIAGPPWDVYITDPATEPDPNKWETHVLYPVK